MTLCIMLTIHSEYLTGLIISQWDFVSIELIQIVRYEFRENSSDVVVPSAGDGGDGGRWERPGAAQVSVRGRPSDAQLILPSNTPSQVLRDNHVLLR